MPDPAPKQVDAWKPAIARIEVRDGNGGQAHGTGTLVTERLVLTALHVVGNRQVDPPTFYDEGGEVVLRFPSHETRGRVVRNGGVSFSPSLDFALVECELPPPGVRPLPLRDVTAAGPDARWASFGFPVAATQTGGGMVVEGNVSDARGEYQGAEALQLYSQQAAAGDGAPVPGLSGGPVVVDGAIVGVLRSSLMADGGGGRNVAGTLFACPARVIAELCAALLPPLETYPGLPGIVTGDLPDEPFRYLAWYREEEAALFFGRNRELAEMYQQVTDPDEAPLLLFYGQSGVGKSSFLAAGLLPRLKGSHEVRYVRREHEAGLLGGILQALGALDQESLADAWRRVEQQTGRPLLVIADQVEEVYSRPSNREDELGDFLGAAAALLRDRSTRPRGRLVLSFRKEWYAEMVAHVRTAGIAQAEVFLQGLDRAGIVEVVRGLVDNPRLLKRYGLTVEDGLAEDIASDLREDRGSPIAPTLQVLLTKMWKLATAADRAKPRFDRAIYEQVKRGDLLREFLREQLAVVDRTNHEKVASGLVLDLLGQHVTHADTAGQRTLAELESAYAHCGGSARALVGELKNAYLLVDSSEDRADHADATRLSHDTLALQVRRMLDESQAPGQRARRILDNRAVEWQGGAKGAALDEADLRHVEQGRAGTRALTSDEERLVQASTAARRARRRRSWVVGGLAGVLAIVALGALMATVRLWRSGQDARQRTQDALKHAQEEQANARRAATEARLRGMAALAENQISNDQQATLTAVMAVGQSQAELGRVLPAVNRALASAVQQARQVPFGREPQRHRTPPPRAASSPAASMLVGHAAESRVSPSPAVDTEPLDAPLERTALPGAELAFLGRNVVLIATGRVIKRWQLTPGAPPKALPALNPGMEDISMVVASPNGEQAASGDVGGNVVVWGKNGRRIASHRAHDAKQPHTSRRGGEDLVTALAFSSDGDHLAIGNRHGGVFLLSLPEGRLEVIPGPGGDKSRTPNRAEAEGGGGYGSWMDGSENGPPPVNAVAVDVDPSLGLTVSAITPNTLTVWTRAERGWKKHGEGRIETDWGNPGFKLLGQIAIDDERGLVTGEENGTVRLWSFDGGNTGKLTNRVFSSPGEGMGNRVIETAHLVGNRIAMASGDDRLRVFHPQGWLVEEHHTRAVTDLAYASDWTRAAYADDESTGIIDGVGLQIGDPRLLSVGRVDRGRALSDAPSLAFSRQECTPRIAASTGIEEWILDLDRRYPNSVRQSANPSDDDRIGAGFVKGKDVLVHGGQKEPGLEAAGVQAASWDAESTPVNISGLMKTRRSTSFDVEGEIAVKGDDVGGVEVFDLARGQSVAHFSNPSSSVPAMVLAHPGQQIVTVLERGFVLSRDWAGKELGIYGCPEGSPDCEVRPTQWIYTAIAQSADGNTLAAAEPEHVHVWSSAGGRGARPNPDHDIAQTGVSSALAVSPDGSVIASASAKGISLYDHEGQLFGLLPSGSGVLALTFDPSGQILASVDKVRTLRLWRVNPDDWLKVACRRLAMSQRWTDADEHAKQACASVRDKAMRSEQIGPSTAE
jgi:WD40 repeat protein